MLRLRTEENRIGENIVSSCDHNTVGMKPLRISLLFFLSLTLFTGGYGQDEVPFLRKKGNATQLVVDGKPFIMLGGELGNSSASTMEYMQPVWEKVKEMHLNTLLVPVYWELIEPQEGQFDFTLIRNLITEARKNNLRIVYLWFGSWKNSMSCYAPAWIKLNEEKYPRIRDDQGRSQEILTAFSPQNLQADKNAFVHLLNFTREFDGNQHTVILVQVENEMGMLPTARDYHPLANLAFNTAVPQALITYLQANRDKLMPRVLQAWKENGFRTTGTWEDIFGKSALTDEIFMAWHYAVYSNAIAEAGKKAYSLPMYVNAALNRPGREPGIGYPSAGPLPHLMDIWKAGAPSINFLAPDIYFPDFRHWADLYTSQGDPLFIPEHRFDQTAAFKALFAIGHYQALGFSPFSIESVAKPGDEPLGKIYGLLNQLAPLISSCQGNGRMEGVLLSKDHPDTTLTLGRYTFTFRHDYTLGWSPEAKADEWPITAAIILQTSEDEYYMAGSGVVVTVKPADNSLGHAGILSDEEGRFVLGKWEPTLYLNGDQTHQGRHLRIPVGNFKIQRFRIYSYQ